MSQITVRESIRDGIAEEMRADDKVFLIGEEVGEYQGAYKVSQGLLDEFGPERIVDTPITEAGFTTRGWRIRGALDTFRKGEPHCAYNHYLTVIS